MNSSPALFNRLSRIETGSSADFHNTRAALTRGSFERSAPSLRTKIRWLKPRGLQKVQRHGFLLFEAMIASVILAVAAVGIASLLLSAQQQQLTLQENSTAILLARQLMEEISSKPFGSPTPIVARASMTYANQYNGYTDTTAGITTLGGVSLTPGDGRLYSRSVSVASATNPVGSLAPSGDLQIVTVTVTTPSGQAVSIRRLITNVVWLN
jgi:Tfp pilus assembly protein PilV